MIFEELKCKNEKQTVLDADQLINYAAKVNDDITNMIDYTSAHSKESKLCGTSVYICSNELDSVPLGADVDARTVNWDDAIEELQECYQLNKNTKQSYRHFVISLADNEKLEDKQWRYAVHQLMLHLGYDNAKYIAFKHLDTDNEHVHIVTSTVDILNRNIINHWQSHTAAQVIMRGLEKEFGLTQIESSNIKNMSYDNDMNDKKQTIKRMLRRKVDVAINSLKNNTNLHKFELALLKEGIQIKLTKNKDETKFIGLCYVFNNISFNASKFKSGNKFTIGGLIKNGILKESSNLVINYTPLSYDDIKHFEKRRKESLKNTDKLKEDSDNFNKDHFNSILISNGNISRRMRLRNNSYWAAYAKRVRGTRDKYISEALYILERDIIKTGESYHNFIYHLILMLIEDLFGNQQKFDIRLIMYDVNKKDPSLNLMSV